MADKYGGTEIPVVVLPNTGFPEVVSPGDMLLAYFGDWLRRVMEFHCERIWQSVSPNIPLVKRVVCNDPASDFNEQWLPALYIFRPGRETREVIESFEQVADDYRFQKGRVTVRWVMNTASLENRRIRDQLIDPIRKAIDMTLEIGRHPCWIHPDDVADPINPLDPKAATQGSSLLKWSGAAVIETDHSGPGQYEHKMKPPAPSRFYEELKMSFFVEELAQYDLSIAGAPNDELAATIESPDQGTGLGPFVLGDAIYT